MTSLARRQWTRVLAARLGVQRLEERTNPDATYHNLAGGNFSQNWTNLGLITANDDWSGVPSIIGYLGDSDAGSPTGVDPTTLTTHKTVAVDVIANQTNPNITNGGVAEFDITDPVVALQGSSTADAPFLLFHLNTTGRKNVTISYNLRDIDGSTDNAMQQVALQYRFGDTENYVNVTGSYVADATTGPSLATLVTPINIMLPAAVENKSTLQLRILTTNAPSNDEWVGIDDIVVTSMPTVAPFMVCSPRANR